MGSGWTGDLLVADVEELENNIASEVHVTRFKEKEVKIPNEGKQYENKHMDLSVC